MLSASSEMRPTRRAPNRSMIPPMIGAVMAVPTIRKLAAVDTSPRVQPKAATSGSTNTPKV